MVYSCLLQTRTLAQHIVTGQVGSVKGHVGVRETYRRIPGLLAELTCDYSELPGIGAGLNTAPELSGATNSVLVLEPAELASRPADDLVPEQQPPDVGISITGSTSGSGTDPRMPSPAR